MKKNSSKESISKENLLTTHPQERDKKTREMLIVTHPDNYTELETQRTHHKTSKTSQISKEQKNK